MKMTSRSSTRPRRDHGDPDAAGARAAQRVLGPGRGLAGSRQGCPLGGVDAGRGSVDRIRWGTRSEAWVLRRRSCLRCTPPGEDQSAAARRVAARPGGAVSPRRPGRRRPRTGPGRRLGAVHVLAQHGRRQQDRERGVERGDHGGHGEVAAAGWRPGTRPVASAPSSAADHADGGARLARAPTGRRSAVATAMIATPATTWLSASGRKPAASGICASAANRAAEAEAGQDAVGERRARGRRMPGSRETSQMPGRASEDADPDERGRAARRPARRRPPAPAPRRPRRRAPPRPSGPQESPR